MAEIEHPRSIRSFVMRGGRITEAQQRALDLLWPQYGISFAATPLDLDTAFGRSAPVTLEIGFGNGDNLADQAAAHPERNYLGVEVHRPGVGRLLLSLEDRQLRNAKVICHDAVEVLTHQVPPQSLSEVVILFPDPWHKKRHHKRRLVQAPFVELVTDRLHVRWRTALCLRLATLCGCCAGGAQRQSAFAQHRNRRWIHSKAGRTQSHPIRKARRKVGTRCLGHCVRASITRALRRLKASPARRNIE